MCCGRGTQGKGGGPGTTRESSTEDRIPVVSLKGVGITQVKWGGHVFQVVEAGCVYTTKSVVTPGHSRAPVGPECRCESAKAEGADVLPDPVLLCLIVVTFILIKFQMYRRVVGIAQSSSMTILPCYPSTSAPSPSPLPLSL